MATVKFTSMPEIPCSLLDVDPPFFKVLPPENLPLGEQELVMGLGEESVKLTATHVRKESDGSCWMRLLEEGQEVGAKLERTFLRRRAAVLDTERRGGARLLATLAVSSPDLPGHQAKTVDISPGGIRFVTDRPVSVGRKLRLEIQSPHQNHPVALKGETVWVAPSGDSVHHVGVRFLGNTLN